MVTVGNNLKVLPAASLDISGFCGLSTGKGNSYGNSAGGRARAW